MLGVIVFTKKFFGEDFYMPEQENVYRDGLKAIDVLKSSKGDSKDRKSAVIHIHGGGFVIGSPG